MREPAQNGPVEPLHGRTEYDDFETVPTSPADIESAGRSCMAIIVLGVAILLVLLVWIVYRTLGGQ